MQVDLAQRDLAIEELFLVVMNDRDGDVREIDGVGVSLADETELLHLNAAEKPETGGIDRNDGAGEKRSELGEDLLADGGRIGPLSIEGGQHGAAAEHGEDDPADEP